MKIFAVLLGALLSLVNGCALGQSAAVPAQRIFNVRDFGATGSGTNFDTAAIQKALDACAQTGGGTVRFTPGIYLSQPLTVRTKTTIELQTGATLLASTNQADFMKVPGDWLKARSGDFIPFISGEKLTAVTFTGGGVIDGSGSVWWDEAEKARRKKSGYTLPRPNLIVIEHGTQIVFENITLQNSPKFHLVPTDCSSVVISNVTILAPEHAANTDAIDPSACQDVLITHCLIDVGDDNVAIKAGKKIAGREFASENITVSDCTFRHGHGMSIGSETAGGVRNVTVKNCTFENTENGIRIKSQAGKGGLVENLIYTNLTMVNVDPAITFTGYYMNNSAKDAATAAQPDGAPASQEKLPTYRNIRVSHLTAICPRAAGIIVGLPENCISNVVFENITLTARTGLKVQNARGIQFKNSLITVSNGPACLIENAEVTGLAAAK
ncbi:MAG TPA: glycoside hydrolase family 28 protein [Verrucomicrobiae bacterium]|jgi:polygalacturonase